MLAAFRSNPFVCFRWYSAIAIFPVAPCWLPLISLIYCTTHPNALDSIALRRHHLQFRLNGCAPDLNEWANTHTRPPSHEIKKQRKMQFAFDVHRCGRINVCVCVFISFENGNERKMLVFCYGFCRFQEKQHSPKCSKLLCTSNRSALMALNWFPSKRRVVSRRKLVNASSSKYSNCTEGDSVREGERGRQEAKN